MFCSLLLLVFLTLKSIVDSKENEETAGKSK